MHHDALNKKTKMEVNMSDKRPIEIIRDGSLAASLWERDGKNGRYFEFTLSRSYKAGEVFRYSTTFHERDTEALKRVIDRAAEGIREKNGIETKNESESTQADRDAGAHVAPAATGPTDSDEKAVGPTSNG
jgi:hypothetical protein